MAITPKGDILVVEHCKLYKYYEHSESWALASDDPDSYCIEKIACDSLGNLYARAGDGLGIARSTDGGINWDRLDLGMDYNSVKKIAASPKGDIYAIASFNGMIKSTDRGQTWIKVNNGIPDYLSRNDLLSIAISHNGIIYVGSQGCVFVSTDDGNSWNMKYNGIKGIISDLFLYNETVIAVGGGPSILVSTDMCDNWVNNSNGLINYLCYSHMSFTINSGFIFIGDNCGILRADLSALTSAPGELNSPVHGLSLCPNPVKEELSVESPGLSGTDFRIVNLLGSEVIRGCLESESTSLDISSLRPGVYVLQAGGQIRTFVKD